MSTQQVTIHLTFDVTNERIQELMEEQEEIVKSFIDDFTGQDIAEGIEAMEIKVSTLGADLIRATKGNNDRWRDIEGKLIQ